MLNRIEFAPVPLVVQAAFVYAATQLFQMILMATFVPSADPHEFNLSQECMKAFITLADVLGLHYLFQKRTSMGIAAVIGLSWSATESLFRRLVPLWVEARSLQFSWNHLLTSIEANISIAVHIAFALLVWLWIRKPNSRSTVSGVLVGQKFLFPVVTSFVRYSAFVDYPVIAVIVHCAMTVIFGLTTWRLISAAKN
eukprot:764408-Hanusia_phi.AAC.4